MEMKSHEAKLKFAIADMIVSQLAEETVKILDEMKSRK
jgi:hypothetical protein